MTLSGRQRILNRLEAGYDVCPVDFQAPTIDGGKPILRVAARIHGLRAEGYAIETVGQRNQCSVYRLTSATLDLPGDVALEDDGQTRWEAA